MSLSNKITSDLKEAMKAKDDIRVQTLRMLHAAFQNAEIEKRGATGGPVAMSPEEQLDVVRKEAKKRKDAIEAYRKGSRPELAEKEERERSIIEAYLPVPLNDEEVGAMVRAAIQESGATSNDFGKVMGVVMRKAQGRADGNAVSRAVKEELGKLKS